MPRGHYPRTKKRAHRLYAIEDQQQRFWKKVLVEPEGCWLWQGSRSKAGYGTFSLGRRGDGYGLAHRLSYQWTHGSIPEDCELDHLCRNRACVNPQHLEAVSHRDNCMRGDAPAIARARVRPRIQACKHGHPATEENRYYRYGKVSHCIPCQKERQQKKVET